MSRPETLDRFAAIAPVVRAQLAAVTSLAHVETFHPNAFDFSTATAPAELDFLSRVCLGQPGHHRRAVAYLTKELAQLAEIERHVSAVLALVMGELQDQRDPVNLGNELHNALSCFAAEELQHANTFHRYVRAISGVEPRVERGLFDERLAVFTGDEHPYVKLVALCLSAYVGESVITVFEHRTDALDPPREYLLTRLLHAHGLDEARHVRIDHVAMKVIYPALAADQRERVAELAGRIGRLNHQLDIAFRAATGELLGVDPLAQNPAAAVQQAMTRAFTDRIYAMDGVLATADEVLDQPLRQMITDFSGVDWVHPLGAPAKAAAFAHPASVRPESAQPASAQPAEVLG